MRCLKVLLLLIGVILFSGCSINKMPQEKPDDFGFVVQYGVGAKNQIDTFSGKVTKDLITAGTATEEITLSKEEMAVIYEEMRKINIMDYPEDFMPATFSPFERHVTPYQSFDFKIRYGDQTKEIHWKDDSLANSASARDLRNLVLTIRQIVENKDEYKNMPEAQGGYL